MWSNGLLDLGCFDQPLRETSGANQRNLLIGGPFHWFPAATDLIVRLSQMVDVGVYASSLADIHSPSLYELHLLSDREEKAYSKPKRVGWGCSSVG